MLEATEKMRRIIEDLSKTWGSIDRMLDDFSSCSDRFSRMRDRMNRLIQEYEALDSRMICMAGNKYVFEKKLIGNKKEVYTRMPATDRDADESWVEEEAIQAITQFAFETTSAICSANGVIGVGAQIMRIAEELLRVEKDA